MSILSFVFGFVSVHNVIAAAAGAVATVSSQKVYAFVTKQTASAKVLIAQLEARVKALEAQGAAAVGKASAAIAAKV